VTEDVKNCEILVTDGELLIRSVFDLFVYLPRLGKFNVQGLI